MTTTIAQDSTRLLLALHARPTTRVASRLHRPTCTRIPALAVVATDLTTQAQLEAQRDARPATCCHPHPLVVDAVRGGAVFRLAALESATRADDTDTCEARRG